MKVYQSKYQLYNNANCCPIGGGIFNILARDKREAFMIACSFEKKFSEKDELRFERMGQIVEEIK